MQIEMLDERRIHVVVSEADITQFQFAQEFSLFRRTTLDMTVFRIFHHVLHTFHLGAHLHQLHARMYHLVNGRYKGSHKSLKGHEHTYGEIALQYIPGTHQQYRHRQQALRQRGQQVHLALLDMHLALLVELPRPQATPVLEEPFLGSGGLDALDVLQTADRRGTIFAFALLCAPDHIQTATGIVAHDAQVQNSRHDANQRQRIVVRQHEYEIEHEQHHIDDLRGKHFDQRMGDRLVELLALLQVAHIAHGEETHRQPHQVSSRIR